MIKKLFSKIKGYLDFSKIRDIKSAFFIILGVLIIIFAFIAGFYMFFIWGIYNPLMHLAQSYDAGTLSATTVVYEVFKFFIKEIVAVFTFWVIIAIGGFTLSLSE